MSCVKFCLLTATVMRPGVDGQLLGGIDDAAVVLPILLGSQDKQAVGQLPVGCLFDWSPAAWGWGAAVWGSVAVIVSARACSWA